MAPQAGLFQPLAEKTAAYSRHLYDIASGTGAEFGKAFEAKTADAQKAFTNLVDKACKNALPVPKPLSAMMKSAVLLPTTLFESVQKAVKQARHGRSQLQRRRDQHRRERPRQPHHGSRQPDLRRFTQLSLDPLETWVSRDHFARLCRAMPG